MRIVAQIPHPQVAITIFQMNDKYLIKLEAGPMEQTFKVPQSEAGGLDGVKKLLDEEFMRKAIERFNEMFIAFKETREKNGQP